MRNLLILAHADDEVIGAASLLLREPRECFLVYLTDSAPDNPYFLERAGFSDRESYRAVRHAELFAALELAGIERRQTLILPVPDQQATRHVAASIAAVRELIDELAPAHLYTHAYEGGHPDHDAAALVAQRAAAGFRAELFEMPYYQAASGVMRAGVFADPNGSERTWALTAAEQSAKRALWDCFTSQAHIFSRFDIAREPYRPAPVHDFLEPPHERPLYYETRPVGWTFDQWRAEIATLPFEPRSVE